MKAHAREKSTRYYPHARREAVSSASQWIELTSLLSPLLSLTSEYTYRWQWLGFDKMQRPHMYHVGRFGLSVDHWIVTAVDQKRLVELQIDWARHPVAEHFPNHPVVTWMHVPAILRELVQTKCHHVFFVILLRTQETDVANGMRF